MTLQYHPGITAFQALFHRLGLPGRTPACSVRTRRSLPARAIAEAPLSVAYAGSRYPAHAISQAVLKLHPASAGRAAVIAERLGSPEERLFSGPLADLARTECGPTSILLLLPTPWHCVPHTVARIAHDARPDSGIHEGSPISHSIPAPILTLGFPEEDYERENNLITASDVRAVILSRCGFRYGHAVGHRPEAVPGARSRTAVNLNVVASSATRTRRDHRA
ncbi:MAG: SAM-dependent methyltransferase [Bilophila wadsworthia]